MSPIKSPHNASPLKLYPNGTVSRNHCRQHVLHLLSIQPPSEPLPRAISSCQAQTYFTTVVGAQPCIEMTSQMSSSSVQAILERKANRIWQQEMVMNLSFRHLRCCTPDWPLCLTIFFHQNGIWDTFVQSKGLAGLLWQLFQETDNSFWQNQCGNMTHLLRYWMHSRGLKCNTGKERSAARQQNPERAMGYDWASDGILSFSLQNGFLGFDFFMFGCFFCLFV